MTPVVLLVHVIWAVDRPRHEPLGNVLRYVVAGVIAGLLAFASEALVAPALAHVGDPKLHWLVRLGLVLVFVGAIEEGCKFLLLSAASRADRELDEPFDWVVYAVSVALGFAALENLRVLWQGAQAGWARAFFAVPVHALLGTLMGSHLARAMRDGPETAARRRWLAVLEPAAWHGVYDALIFQLRATPGFPAALFLLFLVVVAVLWSVAVRRTAVLWRSEHGLPPPILAPARMLARLVRGPDRTGHAERVERSDEPPSGP